MNRHASKSATVAWTMAMLAGTLFCTESSARAQVVDTYTLGHQLWMAYVVIPANTTYEFRTDYFLQNPPGSPGPADTVLTLYDLEAQHTLAGRDGCMHNGEWKYEPSCFNWTNSTSSDKGAWLIARAWRSHTAATTRVFAYPAGTPAVAIAGLNGSASPSTIGGARVLQNINPGRQHWSTAHMPGNSAQHMIMVANSYDIHFLSLFSDITEGLAEADTGDQYIQHGWREIIYGGWTTANLGPVRLLRNDWFDNDADGDGLSTALEASLGTCDNVSDMLATGESCGTRFPECQLNHGSCGATWQCDGPGEEDDNDECIAGVCRTISCVSQLRDTDHDGWQCPARC